MNARQKAFKDAHAKSWVTRLEQVYDRYSDKKCKAFEWCYNKYYNQGHDNTTPNIETCEFRIISYNSQFFTVAWLVHNMHTHQWRLHVETYANTYEFDI